METKVCKGCGRELPTTEFYANKNMKNGLGTYCKECSNRLSTEYARKRRERKKAEAKENERIEFEKKYKVYTNRELAKFNPRELMLELMLELKARGYEGELVFREVKVTEHRISLGKLE